MSSSFAANPVQPSVTSLARLNFGKQVEEALNIQLGTFFTCSYTYSSMATWCTRDTVALHGLSSEFCSKSRERYADAETLIRFINNRGGIVNFKQIPAPETEWQSPVRMVESALSLERDVKQSLWNLAKIAETENDHVTEDYIKGEYLEKQIMIVKFMADLLTNVRRVGDGPGLFVLDRALLKKEQVVWAARQRHTNMDVFHEHHTKAPELSFKDIEDMKRIAKYAD